MPARFFIDPWPPDYDSALQIDEMELGIPEVDIGVETSEWKCIPCTSASPLPSMYFVDGVRRVEARIISQEIESGAIVYGLFGSVGLGAVSCRNGLAELNYLNVDRYLILGGQKERSEDLQIGETRLRFEGIAAAIVTPVDAVAVLQNLMRTAEAELGQRLLSDERCVFVDGPLTYFSTAKQALVGVIKRIHRLYLPNECRELLRKLKSGERTPLFLIRDGKLDRYSC